MVLVVFEGSAVRYPEKEGHKDQRSWEIQLCSPPEADSNRTRQKTVVPRESIIQAWRNIQLVSLNSRSIRFIRYILIIYCDLVLLRRMLTYLIHNRMLAPLQG
jgi:hypothetical protein